MVRKKINYLFGLLKKHFTFATALKQQTFFELLKRKQDR